MKLYNVFSVSLIITICSWACSYVMQSFGVFREAVPIECPEALMLPANTTTIYVVSEMGNTVFSVLHGITVIGFAVCFITGIYCFILNHDVH